MWSTRKSWSQQRRVVAKAEWTRGEANPRFVVTNLSAEDIDARPLYEERYPRQALWARAYSRLSAAAP